MRCHRIALACLAAMIPAGHAGLSAQQLLTGPPHDSGQSVTGVFEGWFHNQDGSFSLLFGYYNRNLKQEPDIPIGVDNRIDPGGPVNVGAFSEGQRRYLEFHRENVLRMARGVVAR